ncbi:MAG TPA: hypothetical protein VF420_06250 [Casimicrobiaceae bacterium]
MSCVVRFTSAARDKANDYAIEALKQLITLAAGILALNITFIKDFLGTARATARWPALVPLGWVFLLIAIWMAWVAIANAARGLGMGEVTDYAFAKGTFNRTLARNAQTAFLLGLTMIGAFAVANFVF